MLVVVSVSTLLLLATPQSLGNEIGSPECMQNVNRQQRWVTKDASPSLPDYGSVDLNRRGHFTEGKSQALVVLSAFCFRSGGGVGKVWLGVPRVLLVLVVWPYSTRSWAGRRAGRTESCCLPPTDIPLVLMNVLAVYHIEPCFLYENNNTGTWRTRDCHLWCMPCFVVLSVRPTCMPPLLPLV